MKIYRELRVRCNEADLDRLGIAIESYLPEGWNRNKKAEKLLRNDVYYCFTSESRPGISVSEVWLTYDSGEHAAWVANVLPKSTPKLGVEEYNRIVEDFYANAVKPAADKLGLQSVLTDEDVEATHWGVSSRTLVLLKDFSSHANKSTGSAHPLDEKRWYDFLISIHVDKADLDATSLGQMLVENYDWPESSVSDLRLEYEFALGLLNRYDQSGR